MQTSEVLNRAADLIEERGWGTGPRSIMSEEAPCLMGAIFAAEFGRPAESEMEGISRVSSCPAGVALHDYLQDRDASIRGPHFLWRFNDAAGRTASEVIEVLRACAVIEASREREAAEVSA